MEMRIIGLSIIGSGEADRWLKGMLDDFKRLCDDALIVGNNTDKKTEQMIKKYKFKFYRDDREWGIYQPLIKTQALKKLSWHRPDWIIAMDADEKFDPKFTREEAEKLAQAGPIAYYFYVVNLWDSEERYNADWSFWNIRFYKFAPEYGLEFERKNLHCGLAPSIAYKYGNHAPFYIKHYGLMKKEDRQKKIERYKKYDPKARFKSQSYYEMLSSDIPVEIFNEEEMHQKVAAEVAKYNEKIKQPDIMVLQEKDYVYMQCKDPGKGCPEGKCIDVPARDAKRYERKGFEIIGKINLETQQFERIIGGPSEENEKAQATKKEVAKPESEKTEGKHKCILCGKEYAKKSSLANHKKKKHK